MKKSIYRICLTMVCLFAPAGNACAQSMEEARAAYAEGRFLEAADLARALKTSEGYALAADSLAIHGYYIAPDNEKAGLFKRAEANARKAIKLDAANPETHLQLAHAMGRQAQISGTLKALKEGYAGKVRDAIRGGASAGPGNAGRPRQPGRLACGSRRRRRILRRSALRGGAKKEALAHFERAIELAPQDKAVLFEYALGLLKLDAEENRAKARDLLERATGLPPEDAFERLVHRKAVERLAATGGG